MAQCRSVGRGLSRSLLTPAQASADPRTTNGDCPPPVKCSSAVAGLVPGVGRWGWGDPPGAAALQVVGHEWVLEMVGADLAKCSQKASSGSFKWNEIEGNLFMLTTVAPRAPAGCAPALRHAPGHSLSLLPRPQPPFLGAVKGVPKCCQANDVLERLNWERGGGLGDGGVWTAKPVKRPPQQPAHPPKRQLLGAADAQTAHPATSSTAPAHQLLGSANAETTPAGAPAAAADRTQRPDATCEGKKG